MYMYREMLVNINMRADCPLTVEKERRTCCDKIVLLFSVVAKTLKSD